MGEVRTVLFLHSTADLYGAGRVLYNLVTGLRSSLLHPIVLLPRTGPLHGQLLAAGVETHILPLPLLQRAMVTGRGLIALPFRLLYSLWRMRRLLARREIALIYSNTLIVLQGAAYGRLAGIPHLWHVHEIAAEPRAAVRGFPALVRWLADVVICNSSATEQWMLREQPALSRRLVTIWNGIDQPAVCDRGLADASDFRARVGAGTGEVVVTLVGRINWWKGQAVLVAAAEVLWAAGYRHIRYAIAGDAPRGQMHFETALHARVARSPARRAIAMLGYVEDVWPVWRGSDIAVVPSTEPEPFGLVAIEAMAAGKPVVAAAHGGLLDIISDQESGLLVPPGDAPALAAAIARLCDDRALRQRIGEAGRRRQLAHFSRTAQIERISRCIEQMSVPHG